MVSRGNTSFSLSTAPSRTKPSKTYAVQKPQNKPPIKQIDGSDRTRRRKQPPAKVQTAGALAHLLPVLKLRLPLSTFGCNRRSVRWSVGPPVCGATTALWKMRPPVAQCQLMVNPEKCSQQLALKRLQGTQERPLSTTGCLTGSPWLDSRVRKEKRILEGEW